MINITKSKMNKFNYKEWISYFSKNALCRFEIDFSNEKELSEKEKNLIFSSIKAFQIGEGSDGKHLMRSVANYINKNGLEEEYYDAMECFVKEENYHSVYLKEYMDFYKVKPVKYSALDFVFRRLRKICGLKSEIITLVTAEMIALTYYNALSRCTQSQVLKSICTQMLHDELAHIIFQSHTLSILKISSFVNFIRIILMEVSSVFVWAAFYKVFRKGGYNFVSFMKENLGYLWQSILLSENN